MKIFFLFLFVSASLITVAQDTTIQFSKYNCKIYLKSTDKKYNGEIFSSGDSAIDFRYKVYGKNLPLKDKLRMMTVPVADIDLLKIKRKGSASRAFIGGILIGAFTGALIGYISGDAGHSEDLGVIYYVSRWEKIGAGAMVGGITGGIIGGLIATAKIKIPIRGKQEHYKVWKSDIEHFSVKGN